MVCKLLQIRGHRFDSGTRLHLYVDQTHIPDKSSGTKASFQIRPAIFRAARKVSLIRVCQPSPLARNAANTSASRRNLTGSLVDAYFGLPRVLITLPSYRSAVSKNSEVSSGASSASIQVLCVECFFAVIGFPHTNDSAGLAAGRPDHNNHVGV